MISTMIVVGLVTYSTVWAIRRLARMAVPIDSDGKPKR